MEGYEEQLGRDSERALEVTHYLIGSNGESRSEKFELYRDLLKRMETALGEENVVTLETLNALGIQLDQGGEYEEVINVYERCLVGRMKVLGKDYKYALATVNNLGNAYKRLGYYEKALRYYERAMNGFENVVGKTHPDTIGTVINIVIFITKDWAMGKLR